MVGYFTPPVALLRQGATGGRGRAAVYFEQDDQEQQYAREIDDWKEQRQG